MARTLPLGLLAALLVAACGGTAPEGTALRVTVVGDATRPGSLARRLAAEVSVPTLVARDGSGQTVAGLASSWRFVDDGRSLILRLRPQKWSDGKDLVAADVVAALRRAATRREALLATAGIAGAQDVLAKRAPPRKLGVMAPIARVVELRLDAASPLLLGWLADPGLGVTAAKNDVTLAAYAASGPAARQILRRVGAVATPAARPATITVIGDPDAKAGVAGFVQGKADIVIGEGLAGFGEARSTARTDALRIDPLWGVYGYVANARRGPTADARVRRALALAVDRRRLTAGLGVAAIAGATSLVPPSLGGGGLIEGDETARFAEAQALITAAGWGAAAPLRLVLLLPPGRDHRIVAEKVAADWARIGVVLAVTEVGSATHDRLVARGNFELAVTEASIAVPDPAALLGRWRCGRSHCNSAGDALLAQARTAPAADRALLLARADAALMAAPPMIPLFTPIRWALVARNVEGWVPNRAASHPLARLAVNAKRR